MLQNSLFGCAARWLRGVRRSWINGADAVEVAVDDMELKSIEEVLAEN